MQYLLRVQDVKKGCVMTKGSRVTPHLSMRGMSMLGNMSSASCNLAFDDTVLEEVGVASDGESAKWNSASGMEKAKFGSCRRFFLDCVCT